MNVQGSILRVAVFAPLRGLFDYLPPADVPPASLAPGMRVRVPFGRRRLLGVIWSLESRSDLPLARLRPVEALLDEAPLLPESLRRLAAWGADYYNHPLGEAVAAMLPVNLREGKAATRHGEREWHLTETGREADIQALKRAPKQSAIIEAMRAAAEPAWHSARFSAQWESWRPSVTQLEKKGWVGSRLRSCLDEPQPVAGAAPALNDEQARAVAAVEAEGEGFRAVLLEGVTGSGKTEVYLALIESMLARGRQVLVLLPEIALTPQLVARFRARLSVPLAVLHSGLADGERQCAWLKAKEGEARVVIGTRSAVFTPLASPGLIVVDEEHDPSYKQQEGWRYSARDLALVRGRQEAVPVLLGSATPSLESLHNAQRGLYRHLRLTRRAGEARPPRIRLLDIRAGQLDEGVSGRLLDAMGEHLAAGNQVMLFLNRRGFAPTLVCDDCGAVADCRRCDAHMTVHRRQNLLRCHHCGAERPLPLRCESCGSERLAQVGAGTERVEQVLARHFPEFALERIDRDTTRRKGELDARLARVREGRARILIGTQMLAKGHDFPDVTLVGILDVDRGLFGVDFRAAERMAQLITQVAGRAGRAQKPGEVLIQTRHPEHPLLQSLIRQGYDAFAREALHERQLAALPPFSHLALIRAEDADANRPRAFLEQVAGLCPALVGPGVSWLGPAAAVMERRAGRYRAQLLLQADNRAALHALLRRLLPAVEALPEARRVRWSLDVDPLDLL